MRRATRPALAGVALPSCTDSPARVPVGRSGPSRLSGLSELARQVMLTASNDGAARRVTPPGFAPMTATRRATTASAQGRDDGATNDEPGSSEPEDPGRSGELEPDGVAPGGIDSEHAETWQLVRLAQGGDGDAFGQLYDRYVDTVFRFVYYRVNDRALAEDFTSETFVRALRRIGSITYQGRDIGAWFVTIARNIVLDHVKSARNRLEFTTADTFDGPTAEPSTEKAVLDGLAAEDLMAAVRQLGDEQRECVTLRFIQGLSVSETASAMGKNDGAIKALQHRAVRKLADLVSGDLR